MSHRIGDLTGKQFAFLTVLRFSHKIGKRKHWWCRCVCGVEKGVLQQYLVNGRTKSCGCQKGAIIGQAKQTHGQSKTREYKIWKGIIKRCTNPACKSYRRYGGRGITICQEWRNSFEAFIAYIGPAPSDVHSVDRFPNRDAGYEPGNVRWATNKQQANNKCDNLYLSHDGATLTAQEWSERLGIKLNTILGRLRLKWSVHDALTVPVNGTHYNQTNRLLTHDGATLSVRDWERRLGVPKGTIASRLRYGWSVERTLTTPVLIKRRRKYEVQPSR